MLDNINQANYESDKSKEVEALSRRQDDLERELRQLKELFQLTGEKNMETFLRVHQRIDKLEQELAELRAALNKLELSVGNVQTTVDLVKEDVNKMQANVIDVHTNVAEINVKQDVAIQAQDKFIGQLWKAFFALLGVVTAVGASLVALLN